MLKAEPFTAQQGGLNPTLHRDLELFQFRPAIVSRKETGDDRLAGQNRKSSRSNPTPSRQEKGFEDRMYTLSSVPKSRDKGKQ